MSKLDISDDGLIVFHTKFLEASLSMLMNPHSSIDNRLAIISWIYDFPIVRKDEVESLSFQAACLFSGYDPVFLRDEIHSNLIRRGIYDLIENKSSFVKDKTRVSRKEKACPVVVATMVMGQLDMFGISIEDSISTNSAPKETKAPPKRKAVKSKSDCEQNELETADMFAQFFDPVMDDEGYACSL